MKKILRNMARRFKVQTGLPSKGRKHQRRRHTRIKMDTGRFQFFRSEGQHLLSNAIAIENISCSGVALRLKDFAQAPKVGESFSGSLRVGKTSFEIECFVIHVTEPIVGCEFTDGAAVLENVLKAAFEVELKTYSVIARREDILKPMQSGMPFYIHDGGKDEIYFEVDKGKIKKFILIFEGVYFEGGEGLELITGQVAYDSYGEINELLSPDEIVVKTSVFDLELLNLAKIYIDNLGGLSEQYRNAIKDLLKT